MLHNNYSYYAFLLKNKQTEIYEDPDMVREAFKRIVEGMFLTI